VPTDALAARAIAFRRLFDAESRYVWNTLRYLGVREADLADLSQEAFVTVYRLFDPDNPPRALRAWLFSILYHAASNHRRLSRHRHEQGSDEIEAVDEAATPEQQIASRQELTTVLVALDTLDLDRRAVLTMHDLLGHAMPEVATSLAIPLNTAYSRLRLARQDFLAAVARRRSTRGTHG
jgi:RNA polymerase sigma-70 factor, ECF subfamily